MQVFQEKDRVILDLGRRATDVLFSWKEGEKLMETLRNMADFADEWAKTGKPTIVTQVWACKVQSYDGLVAVRFHAPMVGVPSRIPLPAGSARKLADAIEFSLQQAAYKMRFEFK